MHCTLVFSACVELPSNIQEVSLLALSHATLELYTSPQADLLSPFIVPPTHLLHISMTTHLSPLEIRFMYPSPQPDESPSKTYSC